MSDQHPSSFRSTSTSGRQVNMNNFFEFSDPMIRSSSGTVVLYYSILTSSFKFLRLHLITLLTFVLSVYEAFLSCPALICCQPPPLKMMRIVVMMMSMIRPCPVSYAKWWQLCFHSLIGNRLQYIHQEESFFAEFQNLQDEYVILNEVFLIIDPCFSSLPYDDDVDHHSSNIIIFNELSGFLWR